RRRPRRSRRGVRPPPDHHPRAGVAVLGPVDGARHGRCAGRRRGRHHRGADLGPLTGPTSTTDQAPAGGSVPPSTRLPPGPRSTAIDRTENTIMTHATPSVAATFAALFAALFVAHQVADHWVQTSHQAAHKGKPGWKGRLACAAHVASYTLCTTLAVLGVWLALDLPVTLGGVLLGQAVSAVTHYWADRRTTLATLAERLRLGGFYGLGAPRPVRVLVVDEHGHVAHDADGRPVTVPVDAPSLGTGAYALDQSWHYAWLGVAALVTVLA